MVRSSAISTDKVSLLTVTFVARAVLRSTAEEFIPTLQLLLLMVLDQPLDSVDLLAPEAVTLRKPDGREPKLHLSIVTFDVDIRRGKIVRFHRLDSDGCQGFPSFPNSEVVNFSTFVR